MCEKEIEDPQGRYGEKISKYYLEAAKYAGRISAGDLSKLPGEPVFGIDPKDFTHRLTAELAELYKPDNMQSLNPVIKGAVFRIFKARHEMIFFQYIQSSKFHWRFIK
jgi:hypothetical protein